MSLAKTALWGILILLGALLLDWVLFVRIANAEPCPQVWVVAQAPDTERPNGPKMTQIAESFDGKNRPNCVVKRMTEDGSFYVKAELLKNRLNVIANFPFGVVCTAQVPCYMVVGVRVNSCNPLDPKLVYVDGTGEVRAVLRKMRHTPGQQKAPDDPALCESEAYVHGYITAPRLPNEPRRFAATIELK